MEAENLIPVSVLGGITCCEPGSAIASVRNDIGIDLSGSLDVSDAMRLLLKVVENCRQKARDGAGELPGAYALAPI